MSYINKKSLKIYNYPDEAVVNSDIIECDDSLAPIVLQFLKNKYNISKVVDQNFILFKDIKLASWPEYSFHFPAIAFDKEYDNIYQFISNAPKNDKYKWVVKKGYICEGVTLYCPRGFDIYKRWKESGVDIIDILVLEINDISFINQGIGGDRDKLIMQYNFYSFIAEAYRDMYIYMKNNLPCNE